MNKDFSYCHGSMQCLQCETCKRYMPNVGPESMWMVEPKLDEELNCELYANKTRSKDIEEPPQGSNLDHHHHG